MSGKKPAESEGKNMSDFSYEIKRHIGTIAESPNGWTKEINVISWNVRQPKIDIRDWSPGHEKASKGVTMTDEEAAVMFNILREEFER